MLSSADHLLVVGLVCLVISNTANSAEKKAYKYTDEKGNVVYSQTPPPDGKQAKKLDISPAHSGPGAYKGREPYVSPARYSTYDRRQEILDEQNRIREEEARRREELRRRQMAQAEEECVRHRGTDCKNPNVVEHQESRRVPLRPRPRP